VLYLLAGLFEALGIVLLAVELWEANRRWRAFMLRPPTIVLSDTARAIDQAMPIRAVGGDRTTETRLTQLVDAMHAQRVEHADQEVAAWRYANHVAGSPLIWWNSDSPRSCRRCSATSSDGRNVHGHGGEHRATPELAELRGWRRGSSTATGSLFVPRRHWRGIG
jgi:hypothetical protein